MEGGDGRTGKKEDMNVSHKKGTHMRKKQRVTGEGR